MRDLIFIAAWAALAFAMFVFLRSSAGWGIESVNVRCKDGSTMVYVVYPGGRTAYEAARAGEVDCMGVKH